MKLKFIIVVIAIAMPLSAQAQKTGAAKVTKADVQKGRQDHQRGQGQDADYYDMANLGDQIEQADQKKDTKKVEELSKKMDEMTQMLRPEYVTLMDGLQDMDANSKDGKYIGATLEGLDKLCGK